MTAKGPESHATFGTYRVTNFRGRVAIIGNRVKHMTKQARAATLQAAKTSNLSHLLTATHVSLVAHEARCLHHMQTSKACLKMQCTCPAAGVPRLHATQCRQVDEDYGDDLG